MASFKDGIISKIYVCGDRVEILEYSCPLSYGKTRSSGAKRKPIDFIDVDELTKRSDNNIRASQSLRRLIWCNITPYSKFITLTYKETVLDCKCVKRDMQTFVQAMRRKGYNMQYIWVMEHQLNRGLREGNLGCLHVHLVLFTDVFVDCNDLKSCWRHGRTEIHKIKNIRSIGAYVSKYMSKNPVVDFNGHMFFCSLGLKRPTVNRIYGFNDGSVCRCDDDFIAGFHFSVLKSHLNVFYESVHSFQYFNECYGQICNLTITNIQGVVSKCRIA